MIRLQTTATSRVIRYTLQALIKAKAISSAHKMQYAKQYLPDEKGRLQMKNIQILILHTATNWEKAGEGILNNVLKDWEEIGEK